jgi:hypothetical protein
MKKNAAGAALQPRWAPAHPFERLHGKGVVPARAKGLRSMPAADYLVHASNILLLLSYSVRDMLWLRWFAVAAAIIVIPYYLAQPTVLWPPIAWGMVFTIINLVQIARIYWERRPVVLSAEEQRLYDLSFATLRPRDFLSFAMTGEWKDAQPGETILVRERRVDAIAIAIDGEVDVHQDGKLLGTMKPGEAVGLALAFTQDPSPIDAAFRARGRYIRWQVDAIETFLSRKPEIRAVLQRHVNRELAGRMHRIVGTSRS